MAQTSSSTSVSRSWVGFQVLSVSHLPLRRQKKREPMLIQFIDAWWIIAKRDPARYGVDNRSGAYHTTHATARY